MPVIVVDKVFKSFADKSAVRNLSFSVDKGEIFGLIGPNGAGKTTTIRMIMDIIKPDSGNIVALGEKIREKNKHKLGYLPEERGLYKKMRVMESIVYLSSLKGLDKRTAEIKADELLSQTNMLSARNKKIEELSKGMGQIIQFIITVIHDPALIVLDEPFTGLDPVNTELLKNMVTGLCHKGKTVILSTHQMSQVEELCDRVLMIDNGVGVLYGKIRDIKDKYRKNSVILDFTGNLGQIPGVTAKRVGEGSAELELGAGVTPEELLEQLLRSGVAIRRFEVATPSLHEIFLDVAGKNHA